MTRKQLGPSPSGLTDTATVGWTQMLLDTFIPHPQVGEITTATSLVIDTDLYDAFNVTALAGTVLISVSGHPHDHQKLMMRIADNGFARTVTWNGAQFRNSGVASLLAVTVPGKIHHVGMIYDGDNHIWYCLAADPVGA